MSKTLRTVGMVVAVVALVATGVGAAAGAGLLGATAAGAAGTVAGMSVATITAIGTYASLAATALAMASAALAPGPTVQGNATKFATNPQSGLPYAMGRTRMSGLRFFADTNTRPGYTKFNDLLWFGALLSIGGPIEGIEKFTGDNELVSFAADGNAVGTYHDYQVQKVHLGGAMATALNTTLMGGTAPGWTSQHRLSGITHAMWCLRFNKQGEMYGAGAPEPAWIGKWVKVYDPRKDSTYPGGSGPHRALNEATYEWSDNPGLHALTWALGRWQNGKRTCGIGAPIANIRVAEFVECANVCEANVWKVGGVEWTTDSKWDTLKRILQAGGAMPTQTGAMIGCMVSTPRTAIATIESRHLLDGLSLAATKSRRDRFNTVIPRYVDEDSEWSLISGTAVTVPDYVTADKGQRTKEIDFSLVQVFSGQQAKQPGQLAAYAIVDSREAGPFTWTTGPEWIGLKTGDVVYLNVPEEGLVNQPVLITRRAIDPASGKVSFAAQTETYSKHAYALGQSTVPPAPFALSAPDLKPPAPLPTSWGVSGTTSGEGFPALMVVGESEMPSADAIVIDYRLVGASEWTNSAILSAVDVVRHIMAPLESETRYDVRIAYRVGSIDGNVTIFENVLTGVGKLTIIDGQLSDAINRVVDIEDIVAPTGPLWSKIDDIDTTVTEQSGTIGDLQGRTMAYWQVEADAGGAGTDAFVTVRAETAPGEPVTSNVAIGADTFMVYNPAAGAWLKTLEVSGGNVRIYGNLAVDGSVTTSNLVDNAVSESNFNILELYGASVGTDDDNMWRDFAYAGVSLTATFNNPTGGGDATAAFWVTLIGTRTGGDNDRISIRVVRDDGAIILPAEWTNILFESGGNTVVPVQFVDPDPPLGVSTYTVQTKNIEGHPAWQRGTIIPLRLSK